MTARALMMLGTGSHVGKSLLTAALCRILLQEGFRVAPFKAQNMALNSAATPDGFEIGRAQAMQAEAAGVAATADMNPILIKPSSDTGSQVIVKGRVWRQVTAADYHNHRVEELFPTVLECYERLASQYEVIVLEGAGSPAEINLKAHDIVNMRMAEAANAECLLIGDIDRGGVFASLYGTLELLEPEERRRVRGYLINKFRGDVSLLKPGLEMIKPRIDIPCLGIIPYLPNVGLDEEDGVAMEHRKTVARVWRDDDATRDRRLRIGVIALPHMSNFTDFDALASEPSVALAYLSRADEAEEADLIIIPGTKQTINDLRWLQAVGFDKAIQTQATRGFTVGVCGGMQILGMDIRDPEGVEGGGELRGLGLLPISTTLETEKITRPAQAHLLTNTMFGQVMESDVATGYEIHLGVTEYLSGSKPLFELTRKGDDHPVADGISSVDGRTVGTYLHGLFDDDEFRHAFVRAARGACRLNPPHAYSNFKAEREARFDRLAQHVRESIELEEILRWLR